MNHNNVSQGTAPRYPAFLSYGFRPFFLLGAIYAGLVIMVWLPVFYGELSLHSVFAPRDWHIHEMLYGYLPAIIAGFLFTALPNWTGRAPIKDSPLLAMVLLWIAGRLAVTLSIDTGWLAAMIVDCGFLAMLTALAAREVCASGNWRNLKVVVVVGFLLASNVTFHLETHFEGAADYSIRLGIAVIVFLLSLIAGRIIPAFTRNWLTRENPGRLPAQFALFDLATLLLTVAALVLWIAMPASHMTGVALLLAGVLHAIRMGRWAGDRVLRDRLLLILHVGYAFLPLGFLLAGAGAFDLIPASGGAHAWMVGSAGVMTLAVMTRASLGHTGRPLKASRAVETIYAAVVVAALARICAAVHPAWSEHLLHIAALAWVVAFFGFGAVFGPMLLGEPKRKDAAVQARAN
ncbi:MAG: NnrS family protein [Rhizobiales bacterium]|nr:NnrS family protein [Hyphomicrobiales bacterium]